MHALSKSPQNALSLQTNKVNLNNSAAFPTYRTYQALRFSAASTSLIGEGRQHAQTLQEALLHVEDAPASPPAVDGRPVPSPISTATETGTKPPLFFRAGKKSGKSGEKVVTRKLDKPPEPTGRRVPCAHASRGIFGRECYISCERFAFVRLFAVVVADL